MPLTIGVPKEVQENECRVATTPEAIGQLQKLGFEVAVESGAPDSTATSKPSFCNWPMASGVVATRHSFS